MRRQEHLSDAADALSREARPFERGGAARRASVRAHSGRGAVCRAIMLAHCSAVPLKMRRSRRRRRITARSLPTRLKTFKNLASYGNFRDFGAALGSRQDRLELARLPALRRSRSQRVSIRSLSTTIASSISDTTCVTDRCGTAAICAVRRNDRHRGIADAIPQQPIY